MSDTFKINTKVIESQETVSQKALNKAVTHLDKVIKISSFVAALGVLAFFGAIGGVLIYVDKSFTTIAVGVFAIGVVISLITLFTIYGIGQIISQNNILLKNKEKE